MIRILTDKGGTPLVFILADMPRPLGPVPHLTPLVMSLFSTAPTFSSAAKLAHSRRVQSAWWPSRLGAVAAGLAAHASTLPPAKWGTALPRAIQHLHDVQLSTEVNGAFGVLAHSEA